MYFLPVVFVILMNYHLYQKVVLSLMARLQSIIFFITLKMHIEEELH